VRPKTLLPLVLLLCGTVGCDQVSKQAALHWLSQAPASSYLGDTFRLSFMENTGAFLGFGADWPEPARWLALTLASSLFVAGASCLLFSRVWRNHSLWSPSLLGLALVVAGGIGNLIDRVARDGAVVDFMNLGIGPLRTGIFNVADVYIMLGAALWLLGERRAPEAKVPG
jgi:signal peptidase II